VADADADVDNTVSSSVPLYSVFGENVVSSKWADAKVAVFGLFALETSTHWQPSLYITKFTCSNRQFANQHGALLQAISLKVSVPR